MQSPANDPDDAADCCASDCGLPDVSVSASHRQVQVTAFAMLFEKAEPLTARQIGATSGVGEAATTALLGDFDKLGRVRFDGDGRVVAIAGLSIEPTRHRLDVGGTVRWTWCALDAIGILGALRIDASYRTRDPQTDVELMVEFDQVGPAATDAVILIADGYGSDSVVDTWCPTVNMFRCATNALAWADEHGVTGRAIPVGELVVEAAAMWLPVVVDALRR